MVLLFSCLFWAPLFLDFSPVSHTTLWLAKSLTANVNLLWPSDDIWLYWSGPTPARVMASLTATNHLLKHSYLWGSIALPQRNFTVSAQGTIFFNLFENSTFEIMTTYPRCQWVCGFEAGIECTVAPPTHVWTQPVSANISSMPVA